MIPLPSSQRQREVLAGLLEGLTERQVGVWLGLSPHTVHSYAKVLYKLYGVRSRAQLLKVWLRLTRARPARALPAVPPEALRPLPDLPPDSPAVGPPAAWTTEITCPPSP